jgi:DNA N-6-adenine-methyltransferase (Dam)
VRPGFVHEASVSNSVEWYTPPWLFAALGLEFDLDPASPIGGLAWVPAKRQLSVIEDGLRQPWRGRVWLNAPYGPGVERWLDRLAEHGDGIALVFNRSDARWWQRVIPRATAVCFVSGRIRFVRSDGDERGHPGAPSALVAFGLRCALALSESGLGVTLMVPRGA